MHEETRAPDQPIRDFSVLVWSADFERAAMMLAAASSVGRRVWTASDLSDLVVQASARMADLLLLDEDSSLDPQAPFLRSPLVLVANGPRPVCRAIGRRAYAIVHRLQDVPFAVDRFQEHARLSAAARARREPPRRCARCARGYDPSRARLGGAERFARFGSISLCGGCVDALQQLLTRATTPYVEAEV